MGSALVSEVVNSALKTLVEECIQEEVRHSGMQIHMCVCVGSVCVSELVCCYC